MRFSSPKSYCPAVVNAARIARNRTITPVFGKLGPRGARPQAQPSKSVSQDSYYFLDGSLARRYDSGMTREARAVIIGVPHHITQRGNNRQDVFFVDDDRRHYLLMLKSKAVQYGLTIHAYCLMTNHVHIVATPLHEESLAKGIGRTHYFYTRYVNKLQGRNGHLWQNRFFSCPLDEPYFLNTVRYIERNPVRARMVRKALRYPWSSAKVHVAGRDPSGLLSF